MNTLRSIAVSGIVGLMGSLAACGHGHGAAEEGGAAGARGTALAATAVTVPSAATAGNTAATGAAGAAAASGAGSVNAVRLANAAAEPGQWFTPGRDAAGSYHSPLTAIDTQTVSRLGFAWQYELGTHRGLEATPVVVDGVMYAVGNFGRVYALDGATGAERWVYDPEVDGQWGRYACCDAVNRGVAVWQGRVYVAALDGYLHAIDAATGRRLWKVDTLPARGPQTPYTSTGAPLIAGDLVVIGAGGGDFRGVRGYVAAFDVGSGRERWRFYTVPRDPSLGAQDQPHLAAAQKTWDAHHRWEMGAGGTVWDGLAYDAALGLIYIGTGNASPYDIKQDGRSGGDDLYTDCILALHADTGQLAWYFQLVPGDMWDFDSTQKMILADLDLPPGQTGAGRAVPSVQPGPSEAHGPPEVHGPPGQTRPQPAEAGPEVPAPRQVLMQASKNGFFYVLDRATGELISANNFAAQNWTRGLDPKSGRPLPNPAVDYSRSPKAIRPWEGGAHGWQPMAYDAAAKRVFIPVQEAPNVLVETEHRRVGLVEGQFTSPAFLPEFYDPKGMASLYGPLPPLEALGRGLSKVHRRGFLRAWDPVVNKLLWEAPTASGWDGGVMSTAGGLVFQGDVAGMLNVYAADTGALLKRIDLGTSVMAAPMSYSVGGVQYVAVMAGYGGGDMGYPFPDGSAALRYGNAGRIIALRLDGGAVPKPPEVAVAPIPVPPPREGTRTQIAAGEVLYNRYCSRCHVFGPGMLPDLRRLTPEKHALFSAIVEAGTLRPVGMGRFDDVLTHADVLALHAYIVDESWKAQPAP